MLLRAFMLILSETVCLSASLASVTVCRLGRNTRFFLLFAWLTRCPLRTPFPVNSQRLDMAALAVSQSRGALLRKAPLARQAFDVESALPTGCGRGSKARHVSAMAGIILLTWRFRRME